jgi:hypothetical protein
MGKTVCRKSDNEIYKLLSYQIDDDRISIATDRDWLETTYYNLQLFMEEFIIVETPEVIEDRKPPVALQKKTSVLPTEQLIGIRDILLDNIKKVQEDPSYIKQAQSVTNSVNALVNLAKTEIQYRRNEE